MDIGVLAIDPEDFISKINGFNTQKTS